MIKWLSIVSLRKFSTLRRGTLLKFRAAYPFEEKIVLMICENRENLEMPVNLIVITGHKAGINPLQNLPSKCLSKEGGLSVDWLISNWGKWIYPECDIDDVMVKLDPISVEEINFL
jgi:Immunity protein 45